MKHEAASSLKLNSRQEKLLKANKPRNEYVEGLVPLNFHHRFPEGEELITYEEKGVAQIVLVKDGKEIFNFAELLPIGSLIITPSYQKFHRTQQDEDLASISPYLGWQCSIEGGYIMVGDWRKPEEFIALLHEIGHSLQNKKLIKHIHSLQKDLHGGSQSEYIHKMRQLIQEMAKYERDAWAYAVKQSRRIKRQTSVDLMSIIFTNTDQLLSLIKTNLSSYRREYRDYLKNSYFAFPNDRKAANKLIRELTSHFDKPKQVPRNTS